MPAHRNKLSERIDRRCSKLLEAVLHPRRHIKLLYRVHKSKLLQPRLQHVPNVDGEYEVVASQRPISFFTPSSPTSSIIHCPTQPTMSVFATGDNAQDSFTPSPPFGPLRSSTATSAGTTHLGCSAQPSPTSTQATFLPTSDDNRVCEQSVLFQPAPSKAPYGTHLDPIPELDSLRSLKCSIETVERASAAKIFLELHYNQIFTENHNSRSVPSSHRQLRALKSGVSKRPGKVSLDDFENVRVLGKGSFGVVRLVRKQKELGLHSEQEINCDGHVRITRSSEVDLSHLTKDFFAMKIIRKSKNLLNTQEAHLRAERDFLLTSAYSKWVIGLVAAFQDCSNLYLVMDYMVGGDFLGVLIREDVLSEGAARSYIAQMILCVEEVHKMKWIHRDIKPDNFLISASGHIKISDFGLAFDGHWTHQQQYYNKTRENLCEKLGVEVHGDAQDIENDIQHANARKVGNCVNGEHTYPRPNNGDHFRPDGQQILDHLNRECRRRLARSVVGTSQYMAPEVIRGEQYDGRCDWWSIGIILYECLYGGTPFKSDTREDTKKAILGHALNLRFPNDPRVQRPQARSPVLLPHVSDTAIDLICRLLTSKETRLSSHRYRDNDFRRSRFPLFVFPADAEDIKSHPFFCDTDWENLHRVTPPWVPTIRHDQDLAKWFEFEEQVVGTSDVADFTMSEPAIPADRNALSPEKRLYAKAPKRPRDKILRDPVTAPIALELRKQNGFLGYEYRRPGFECLL